MTVVKKGGIWASLMGIFWKYNFNIFNKLSIFGIFPIFDILVYFIDTSDITYLAYLLYKKKSYNLDNFDYQCCK